jgi:hypothetical protein
MEDHQEKSQPQLTSVHVEFVPRGFLKPDREIGTYVDPERTLKDVIATIVAESYNLAMDKENSTFRHYTVYINRHPETPFFPIAATQRVIDAFNKSLAHPRHEQVPDAMLMSSIDIVVKKYRTSSFTVYEVASPS